MNAKVRAFSRGIHDLFSDEIIPQDALSHAQGWITKNGNLEFARGRKLEGNVGTTGSCSDIHTGYTVRGTAVKFKKSGTTIKTLVGATWTDVITGLTEDAPTSFSNYTSLAGAFVYIYSTDGIYKIVTANPTSFTSLYDAAKNFKGTAFIDKGRAILWGREKDKTGLYGSWIDAQDSTTYTTITGEATVSLGGTLAFKSAGATRTCFAVTITITAGGQVFSDNYDGTLTGSAGGTGTINYTSGVYTLSASGVGTAVYQWENTNAKGVTDFTYTLTRVASEGFVFPQDIGGDGIQVVIPLDGKYFSLKERSVYTLSINETDLLADNQVFRSNIGVPSRKAAVATSKGIIFIDVANGENPVMRFITRNPVGDNFDTLPIFPQFNFANYSYADAALTVYGDYVLVACKSSGATANDTILLCNYVNDTVDILPYESKCFTQHAGNLYAGDSLSTSSYQILNGFDDLGYVIENFAQTKAETFEIDDLKKIKKLRLKGLISTGQNYSVYGSFDDAGFQLLGTVSGDATYVDMTNPNTVGLNLIGADVIGGSDSAVAYPYYCELKIKTPKFRKRHIKFVANGFGYASVESLQDFNIWTFENKIPKKSRQKQNVSINDGITVDMPVPNY